MKQTNNRHNSQFLTEVSETADISAKTQVISTASKATALTFLGALFQQTIYVLATCFVLPRFPLN
jgi:hypothetical protein